MKELTLTHKYLKNIAKIDYSIISILNNRNYLWLVSIIALQVYLFPLYFFGENVKITVYDNLDIVVPLSKLITHSQYFFASSNTIVPNIMGGLPRFSFGSELNGYTLLFYFFKPFTAYLINETLIHITAFLSMLVFLSHYCIEKQQKNYNLIIFSSSLIFAFMPFYSGSGLSVPLIPLVMYALFNIKRLDLSSKNWLILALTPLYSSLVLVYFFVLLLAGIYFLVVSIKEKKIHWYLFLALSLMSIMFLVVEHHLVYSTFFMKDYVSHRVEFANIQTQTLFEAYRSAHLSFLNGLKNMPHFASVSIIPLIFFSMIISFKPVKFSVLLSMFLFAIFFILIYSDGTITMIFGQKYTLLVLVSMTILFYYFNREYRKFSALVLLSFIFSFWYGFWFSTFMYEFASNHFHFAKEFNLSRLTFLYPVLWIMILALTFSMIAKKVKFIYLFVILVTFAQLSVFNEKKSYSVATTPLTFKSYYAEHLFSDIKNFIGKDVSTYRVGSLAIHPAISQYNGFYTIDGYIPNYPLSYKHAFQKIIEKSFTKDKLSEKFFEEWGSKCFLFDGGESFLYFKPKDTIDTLNLDFDAFYNLGGRYLFSAYELKGKALTNLKFLHKFTDNETFWKIYLYEVIPSKKYE